MRAQCQVIDLECQEKNNDLNKLKELHNQQAEHRRFLEEQIMMAIDGRQKLQAKKDELTEELKQLEEEEDVMNQDEEGTIGSQSP